MLSEMSNSEYLSVLRSLVLFVPHVGKELLNVVSEVSAGLDNLFDDLSISLVNVQRQVGSVINPLIVVGLTDRLLNELRQLLLPPLSEGVQSQFGCLHVDHDLALLFKVCVSLREVSIGVLALDELLEVSLLLQNVLLEFLVELVGLVLQPVVQVNAELLHLVDGDLYGAQEDFSRLVEGVL